MYSLFVVPSQSAYIYSTLLQYGDLLERDSAAKRSNFRLIIIREKADLETGFQHLVVVVLVLCTRDTSGSTAYSG